MATYLIENTRGRVIGEYDGATPAEALDTYARDAGYPDYAALCKVAPVSDDEIAVTLIN